MCNLFVDQNPARFASTMRRMRLNGQSTSIRMERAFWEILDRLALDQGMTTAAMVSKLHSEVLERHGEPVNFTSILRCACLISLETPPQTEAGADPRRPRHRWSGGGTSASACN